MSKVTFLNQGLFNSLPPLGVAGRVSKLLNLGRCYNYIVLKTTNIAEADLGNISLKINGEYWFTLTAAEIIKMNQYDGMAPYGGGNGLVGYVFILFSRFNLMERRQEILTSMNVGYTTPDGKGIRTAEIEVDVLGTTVSAPRIELWAQTQDIIQGLAEQWTARHRNPYTRSFAQSGTYQITDIVINNNTSLSADKIHILHDDSITNVRVFLDNDLIWERDPGMNNAIISQTGMFRFPQAKMFTIDPSEWGYGDDMILFAGTGQLKIEVTLSKADTLKIVPDFLGVQ